MTANTASSFWKLVERQASGCWHFTGTILRDGYGQLSIRGRRMLAHRAAWQFIHGAIPRGLLICHRCDNRRCVRPAHLFLGTHADNNRDTVAKGRHRHGNARGLLAGEKNGRAKLTAEEVIQIRFRYAAGASYASLREAYGVVDRTINQIAFGRQWKNVGGPIFPNGRPRHA